MLLLFVTVIVFNIIQAETDNQDTSPGCPLPALPKNGEYFLDNNIYSFPGEIVPQATILWYSCDPDYFSPTKPLLSKCRRDGTWSSDPVCIQSRQNINIREEQGCPLPPIPNHGSYVIAQEPGRIPVPGELMRPYSVLEYTCERKYDPSNKLSICLRSNSWEVTPVCSKRCELKTSLTVDFSCQDHMNTWRSCTQFISHNTSVYPRCKYGHVMNADEFNLDIFTCRNGYLGTIPKCKPDCGIEKSFSISYVHRGQDVEEETFPWHVGIYQVFQDEQEDNMMLIEQICGGSIVYSNVVISAGHCFWDSSREIAISAEYFRVAAGKFLRSWDKDRHNNLRVQKREVSRILLHEDYRGERTSQGSDLAIVVLKEPLQFSPFVKAVCFDLFRDLFDDFQTATGKIGKVAGWGITEKGVVSEELKGVSLPVRSKIACRKELDKYSYDRYLTADKICAGYTNGTSVCRGDSGGGLVFPYMDDKSLSVRWYLRGVVSNGPLGSDMESCQPNTYTVFTKFYSLRDWLKKEFRKLMST